MIDLAAETDRLLDFAAGSRHPDGGFAWLRSDGTPDLERPRELWITTRMTHVFALGVLLGPAGRRRARRARARLAALATSATASTAAGSRRSAVPRTSARTSTSSSCWPRRARVIARCSVRRWRCSTRTSGTSAPGRWSTSATATGRRSRPTAAPTRTCTASRRCSRPRTRCGSSARGGSRSGSWSTTTRGSTSTSTTSGGRCRTTTARSRRIRSGPTARRSGTGSSGRGSPTRSTPPVSRRTRDGCSRPRSSTAGTAAASSTPSTGTGGPSSPTGCTGSCARRSPPPRCWARTRCRRSGGSSPSATSSIASDGSWRARARSRPTGRRATVWDGKPDVYHALQATLIPRFPLAPSLAASLRRR